jgi:hypothetical protein
MVPPAAGSKEKVLAAMKAFGLPVVAGTHA